MHAGHFAGLFIRIAGRDVIAVPQQIHQLFSRGVIQCADDVFVLFRSVLRRIFDGDAPIFFVVFKIGDQVLGSGLLREAKV